MERLMRIHHLKFTDKISRNILFGLGFIAGSNIQLVEGFYLAHFVIIILFVGYVKFDKTDTVLYLIFCVVCILSTLLNLFFAKEPYKIINLVNSIFLYSTILIRISYQHFILLFKGFFASFVGLLLIVIFNFKLSLFANGFLLFFVQDREWFGDSFFFGNTFAIYGLIVAYIFYRLINKNLLIFLGVISILILTTSRLSLFGFVIFFYLIIEKYFFGKKYAKYVLGTFFLLLIVMIAQINFDDLEGATAFSDHLGYADDRANLSTIAKELFLRNPIIGNGPIYIEKYTLWEPHLHNIWFDLAVGYGVFGVGIYFCLFAKKMINHFRTFKDVFFVIFILLASISQISLKAPFVGMLLFSYLNLFPLKKSIQPVNTEIAL